MSGRHRAPEPVEDLPTEVMVLHRPCPPFPVPTPQRRPQPYPVGQRPETVHHEDSPDERTMWDVERWWEYAGLTILFAFAAFGVIGTFAIFAGWRV